MRTTPTVDYARVAESADFGKPAARKTGRDPRWPYVPVIVQTPTEACPKGFSQQIKGLAFATRAEAITAAQDQIARERDTLERRLANPRNRALRVHHGLPSEAGR